MFSIRLYHILRRGIKNNPHSLRLAQVAEPLYADSRFAQLSGNLVDERLSLCNLLNWARTIADCIENDPMPFERLGYFERQLSGRPKLFEILFYPFNTQDLNNYERAAIWGAAYFWLVTVAQTKLYDVLEKIKEIGLRNSESSPYFAHFYVAADFEGLEEEPDEQKEEETKISEEVVAIADLERGIRSYPTYAEQSKAFAAVNNVLLGNEAWNRFAPSIRNKINELALSQMKGGNMTIAKNYGSIIGNNYGNNNTEQLWPGSRK